MFDEASPLTCVAIASALHAGAPPFACRWSGGSAGQLVGMSESIRDFGPVWRFVKVDADPPARTHVWRREVALGVSA